MRVESTVQLPYSAVLIHT